MLYYRLMDNWFCIYGGSEVTRRKCLSLMNTCTSELHLFLLGLPPGHC